MFDPPSNLPLEPLPSSSAKPPAAAPRSVPAPRPAPEPTAPPAPPSPAAPSPFAPVSPPTVPQSPGGKKEPEDIFGDLDVEDQKAPPAMGEAPSAAPHRGHAWLNILAVIVGLVVVGGIAWAVWYFLIRSETTTLLPKPPEQSAPNVVTTEPEPIVEVPPAILDEEPEPSAPITNPPPGTNLPPPQSITTGTSPNAAPPSEAIDSDADGLSDPEEPLFGTSASVPDSDGDGYGDGSEVQNGYDPSMPKTTLVTSSKLRLTSIGTRWKVAIPNGWILGSDVTAPGDYALQTGTPATFSFHVSQKPAQQSFADWLAMNEPTVAPTDLRAFTTKSGYTAWQTTDRLKTYIVTDTDVLVVQYLVNTGTSYDFRAIYEHIVQTIVAS